MAIPILIYGKSGAGKTRSLKNFGNDEICLIQCIDKLLPFKDNFTYKMVLKEDEGIPYIKAALLKAYNKGAKTAVIDDATYIMTKRFMNGHRNLIGNQSFELYNNIGDEMYTLIKCIKELPTDLIVYVVFHEDVDDYGNIKLRTIGKLLDQKVCIEGMVTICIHAIIDDGKHLFEVNSDGHTIAKSPEDMFESITIDNDLKHVDEKIREYYELK